MEENNRIIAEFMGWSTHPKHGDKYLINKSKDRVNLPWYSECNWEASLGEFKYHLDWNILMPVIEKIESIKDSYHGRFGVYINSNSCTIQSTNFRPDKPISNPPHYYDNFVLNNKIESTYYSIINFINFYNKRKEEEIN
jgi:hypothetical protein